MGTGLHRAILLTLALIVAAAAAVPPSCAGSICCAPEEGASLHAEMPCCETQAAFSPEQPGIQRAAVSKETPGAQQLAIPSLAAALAPRPARVAETSTAPVRLAPPPPFLLNAQFRI